MNPFNATVSKRIDLAENLMLLYVQPEWEIPDFLPGQYTTLGLPGTAPRPEEFDPEESPPKRPEKLIKRAYSIGSSPTDKSAIELYICVLPQGALTARLAPLQVGDPIFMGQKIVGTFTLEGVPDDAHLILVSTGTGLAPYMSMIRTPEIWTPQRRVTIVHGARYACDLGYRDELLTLQAQDDRLRYFPVVSREDWLDGSDQGARGYVQAFFENGTIILDPACDHLYLCGNPAMVEDMEKLALERKFSLHTRKAPGNLHLEKYW